MPRVSGCSRRWAPGKSGWQIDQLVEGKRVWPLIAWALVPGGLLALLALKGLAWPGR